MTRKLVTDINEVAPSSLVEVEHCSKCGHRHRFLVVSRRGTFVRFMPTTHGLEQADFAPPLEQHRLWIRGTGLTHNETDRAIVEEYFDQKRIG